MIGSLCNSCQCCAGTKQEGLGDETSENSRSLSELATSIAGAHTALQVSHMPSFSGHNLFAQHTCFVTLSIFCTRPWTGVTPSMYAQHTYATSFRVLKSLLSDTDLNHELSADCTAFVTQQFVNRLYGDRCGMWRSWHKDALFTIR